jgi:hypothetical protein
MDMPTTDFVRAGSLEELKAKGRLVVHGPHRPQVIPATVLRPAFFMQNDLMFRDALKAGIYRWSIGDVGGGNG